ncbi:hypothetical protein EVAR_24793_1 [Eumeta japonica]|uniref:Uncharacterized protein n=1 Tax=Eumeta variegata TaxID=151549 RepID=A0A4C1W214_EUMVA|nr:hypothetical protein EVAR_24793_1 [Eumeta japonica]
MKPPVARRRCTCPPPRLTQEVKAGLRGRGEEAGQRVDCDGMLRLCYGVVRSLSMLALNDRHWRTVEEHESSPKQRHSEEERDNVIVLDGKSSIQFHSPAPRASAPEGFHVGHSMAPAHWLNSLGRLSLSLLSLFAATLQVTSVVTSPFRNLYVRDNTAFRIHYSVLFTFYRRLARSPCMVKRLRRKQTARVPRTAYLASVGHVLRATLTTLLLLDPL